ncbi:unnamed protein product [Rotaria socialis]
MSCDDMCGHLHGKSPLLSLFFDMKMNCPFDYMYLCCSHSCFGDESFLGSLKRSRREQPTTTINNIFADEKIYDMSYLDPNVHRDYFVYFKNLYQIQFNAIIDNTFSLYCCFLRGIVKFS